MALRRANALAIQSTHPCRLQTHTHRHTHTRTPNGCIRACAHIWVYGCLEIIRNGGMAGVVRQRVSYGLAAAVVAAAAAAAVDVACRPHAVDPVGFSCACPNLRNGIACSGWCHQSSGTCFFLCCRRRRRRQRRRRYGCVHACFSCLRVLCKETECCEIQFVWHLVHARTRNTAHAKVISITVPAMSPPAINASPASQPASQHAVWRYRMQFACDTRMVSYLR